MVKINYLKDPGTLVLFVPFRFVTVRCFYIFGQRIELSTLEWTLNHEIVVKTVPSYHLGLRKKKKNGANVYNMSSFQVHHILL